MVHILKDANELSYRAAEIFCKTASEAVEKNERFTVALTGGSSPIRLYKLLAHPPFAEKVPWLKTFFRTYTKPQLNSSH